MSRETEIREAMAQAHMELAVSGTAQPALKAGDRAPDFRLPDARVFSGR